MGNDTFERVSGEPMTICGLARAKKGDIDRCYEAVHEAKNHRIHTFLATSDIHLQYKLKIDRSECLRQIDEMVRYAKLLLVQPDRTLFLAAKLAHNVGQVCRH